MSRKVLVAIVCGVIGCGSSPDQGTQPAAQSFIGTTDSFVAWADAASGVFVAAPMNSYAGKRQSLRGAIDFLTGAPVDGLAGVEVYKGDDGHIYALDLDSTGAPLPAQLSNEAAATIDDLCTLSGTVVGANTDYAGVMFAPDLQTPTNSAYIYRLPGADAVCNSDDDVVHMVRMGMSASDDTIAVPSMPVATVRTSAGGIAGFVVKRGADLMLFDASFASSVVLGTMGAAIGVAEALPIGLTQGYPTEQLYVIDGDIVSVDYSGRTISTPLFTIPGWSPTSEPAIFAASPSTLYFAVNTAAGGGTPASAVIYAMPANGADAPAIIDSEAGRIANMSVPVNSSRLVFGAITPTYTPRVSSADGRSATTLATAANGMNGGNFTATASTVYYTTWTQTTNNTVHTRTRTATSSGIVSLDGTAVQALLLSSSFMNGGEQQPWPNNATTVAVPFAAVLQVQGLTPISVTDAKTGDIDTYDGVAGGALIAIDTSSNSAGAALGTLPAGTAVSLDGTFRGDTHTGFIEAANPASTTNPTTRDHLIDSQSAGSLVRMTNNL